MHVSTQALNRTRRTQEERRAETRRKLIDATIIMLQDRGAAHMTMAEIAHKAGLTRGAIQYHFETPKDLLKATVAEIAARMGGMLKPDELRRMDLASRIDHVVDTYWKSYTSGVYVAFLEIAVQGRLDPELGQAVRETLDDIETDRAEVWVEIFSDTGLSRDEITSCRTALQVVTRGLALSKMIAHPDDAIHPEIERFKEMFKHQLGAG